MISVEQLLSSKKINTIYNVHPNQMVIEALELMAEKNIGAVVVLDNTQLVGIFSERDYARKGIIQGRKAKSTPVSEVMTPKVFTIDLSMNINDCLQVMGEKHIRHLPVLSNGQLVGLVSVSDIVNAIMHEQNSHIKHLEQFIRGSY
jgi:CBS domain-containing protein